MSIFQDHLRRHVFWTTTEWVGTIIDCRNVGFGQTKIGDISVTINVNHDVLWLEVSVNNIMIVNLLQPEKNFGNVKSCCFLIHFSKSFDQIKQLSTFIILHNKYNILLGLKCIIEFSNVKLISQLDHDISLVHDDFLFLVFDNKGLWNHFHGIKSTIFFESAQINITKTSASDTLNDLKGTQSNYRLFYRIHRFNCYSHSIQERSIFLMKRKIVIELQIVISSLKWHNLSLSLRTLIWNSAFFRELLHVIFQKLYQGTNFFNFVSNWYLLLTFFTLNVNYDCAILWLSTLRWTERFL